MTDARSARTVPEAVLRLVYLAAAAGLIWVSTRQSLDVRDGLARSEGFRLGSWTLGLGTAVLSGTMLAVAFSPFWARTGGYRWGIALALGVLPAIRVVADLLLLQAEGAREFPARWLIEIGTFPGPFGVVLGLAIMAGFTTREPAGSG